MNDSNKKTAAQLVRRWALVNATDISRTESWLEHMAAQGLFFHNFSGWSILAPGPLWIVLFQKDAPRPERRYRLCPTRPQEAEPSQETLELYAQAGWQFLRYWGTSCVSYYLFYSDDPAAPEPYTDPDSLYEALRPPEQDLINNLLFGGVLLGAGVILNAQRILGEQFTSLLPNWTVISAAVILIALCILNFLGYGLDWLTVRALRREIRRRDTVRPTPPHALFAVDCLLSSIRTVLQVGILVTVLSMVLALFRVHSDLPLEQFDPDFDLLTLSEMEGDGSWTPEPDLEVADQLLRFNAADAYQDPGRGVQMWYDVSQAGYGTSRDSSMGLNYFVSDDAQAAWELLAGLVQDLQSPDGDLLSYLPDQLPFQRETVPGAEEFLVRRAGENWDVVALEGDRALALRYSGALDLTDWYDEIAAMLTPNS